MEPCAAEADADSYQMAQLVGTWTLCTWFVVQSVKLQHLCICVPLACIDAGAEFSPVYHPGTWISRAAKYSCCDAVNKRSMGCIPITHKVPEGQSQLYINRAVLYPYNTATISPNWLFLTNEVSVQILKTPMPTSANAYVSFHAHRRMERVNKQTSMLTAINYCTVDRQFLIARHQSVIR